MYIVQTCMYTSIGLCLFLNYINMYIHCTNVYMQCFVAHVECTTRIIHFMKCTDIAQPSMYIAEPCTYIAEPGTYFAEPGSCRIQLFDSPGLLACNLGLVAAYSSSSTQV